MRLSPTGSSLKMEKLTSLLAGFVIATISRWHYTGVALLMAIESACIPLPSEIVMPFAGYLAAKGTLTLWGVAVAGAVGSVLGSWLAYALGAFGGRPLVERYGRYVLISRHDLDMADRWFARHGDITIFLGRMLPVVRTFIAFPAGTAKMSLWRFTAYTFLGSLIWCWGLAWIGVKLGQHWDTLGVYFHRFDVLIGIIVLAGIALYVWRHVRHLNRD